MKPMCGPALGLPIALRAALGAPTFVRTRSTIPGPSSWRNVSAISLIFLLACSREVPGASRT